MGRAARRMTAFAEKSALGSFLNARCDSRHRIRWRKREAQTLVRLRNLKAPLSSSRPCSCLSPVLLQALRAQPNPLSVPSSSLSPYILLSVRRRCRGRESRTCQWPKGIIAPSSSLATRYVFPPSFRTY